MARTFNCKKCKNFCEPEVKAACILRGKCERYTPVSKIGPRLIFLDGIDFHERMNKDNEITKDKKEILLA
ncbi:hypothetical protein JW968_04700 [Candidatus Woesearchaeota archaeon]|nr:hypothetical protein [Candidatus Woesearchaeota archaeon]